MRVIFHNNFRQKDPKLGEWVHWIVVNIPAHNGALFTSNSPIKSKIPLAADLFTKSAAAAAQTTLVSYVGAAPPKGSGLHRYCFVLYRYKGTRDFGSFVHIGMTGSGRSKFKCQEFAHKYNLGHAPVAVACFEAEYDDHVPLVYASLKH